EQVVMIRCAAHEVSVALHAVADLEADALDEEAVARVDVGRADDDVAELARACAVRTVVVREPRRSTDAVGAPRTVVGRRTRGLLDELRRKLDADVDAGAGIARPHRSVIALCCYTHRAKL